MIQAPPMKNRQRILRVNKMNPAQVKIIHMRQLAGYRRSIIGAPPLKNLFLELTLRCNERCIHCGSRCGEHDRVNELSKEQYRKILDDVKRDFGVKQVELDITGGEPLLRRDFFDIMSYANSLGFRWGMTSNATLINDDIAHRLHECGMKTISVSIDGLESTHDSLRGMNGAFSGAMRGIDALIRHGGFQSIQVTTVVNHRNFSELDELFDILCKIDIDSWRVINIEPIGRALDSPDLMLTKDEYRQMFDFIREKRLQGYPLTYGCSHYLGTEYERQVRQWYFLCNAGIYTASIASNGDILACLDIERRPELVQGNILRDSLKEIWQNKFKIFRGDLSDLNEKCRACDSCEFCHGGAHHSWDYDLNEQRVCFKDILF